jgi:RHS repeat-associated protein
VTVDPTSVDPTGKNLITTNAYDVFGNLSYTSDPNQNSAAHNGSTTVFSYDANRQKTYTYHHIGAYNSSTLNAASQTLYDALGRPYEEDVAKCFNGTGCPNFGSSVASWVKSKVTTFTPTSKEATVTDADGSVTSFSYDAADRKFVTTDPVQRQTELVYDAAGNVLQEIRGLGSPAQITYATYTYGPDGEKTSVQDADGATHVTQFTYDGFNRLYQNIFPDGSTETIPLSGGYDPQGNVLQRISRAGKTFNMTYDSLNRLLTTVVPSYTPPGSSPVLANTITNQYDLGGRLLSTSDTVGTHNSVTHQYDTAGRLSQTATTIVGLSGALTSLYQLDANGNRTQLQWPDGYQVNYAYDTSNRMLTATDSASTVLGTYTYDAMSRRTNLAYGNTASLAYAYTDAGDLTSLTNDFVTNSKNVVYTLAYNDAHQLASETISKSTYRYAPNSGTDSYGTINTLNQYASVTPAGGTAQAMSYDGNGNLTGDGAMNLAYDPENHLVLVSGSASATYAFDPLGRRQTKTVGSTITNFLGDGDDEIAEYDGSGNLERRFVPGPAINSPIAYENCTALPCTGTNMVTEYYHTDHHGSVIAMSGSTGNPVTGESNYTYDAYGNNPGMTFTGQPFRYVGMYLDAETGLYADRARVYAPYLGRFLQTDPVGYKDDVDLYTYTTDDPTDKTDPSGRTLTVLDPNQQKIIAGWINEKASATYGFDANGHLVKTSDTNTTGGQSKYYSDRLDGAIASTKDIKVQIAQTRTFPVSIDAQGNTQYKTYDIDAKPQNGGLTVSWANANPPYQDTTVSGHAHNYTTRSGSSKTAFPSDILMHELVGHAIPRIIGGGTGNAVEDENIVRDQTGQPKRMAEPKHVE